MKYVKKFVGNRIYLSPMSLEDSEVYTKWMNDSAVTDGLGATFRLQNVESERNWVRDMLEKNEPQFAIVRLEDDVLIGNCGLQEMDQRNQSCAVGIFIGEEDNRSGGYGAEALSLLTDYAFNQMNMNNVMLRVFSFNERAIACYKKVGFKEFGRRHSCYYLNGKFYDNVFMEILKDDFNNKK